MQISFELLVLIDPTGRSYSPKWYSPPPSLSWSHDYSIALNQWCCLLVYLRWLAIVLINIFPLFFWEKNCQMLGMGYRWVISGRYALAFLFCSGLQYSCRKEIRKVQVQEFVLLHSVRMRLNAAAWYAISYFRKEL